jgi:RNA-directed DNA polymerase
LANLVLDGLERELEGAFRAKALKVHLVRYADDFIITGARRELLEDEVRPLVEQFLRDRGLELSPEKTCITHIEKGFDFLGQNVRRFGRKLLIQPSKKNTHAFLEKAREIIRNGRGWSQEELIRQLNPVVRGWANYHRHIVVARTFRKVEAALWQSLWRWAKRRHPNKSWKWIAGRYWHRINGKKVFAADTGERTREGKTVWLRLVNIVETKVRRHVKIKAAANPYDPQWRRYFEERAFFKWYGVHQSEVEKG